MASKNDNNQYRHPAVKVIEDVLSEFGGMWPPRPSFDNWPRCLQVYQEIADDMPKVCHDLNNAEKFRQWMENTLLQQVDLTAVLDELQCSLQADNPVSLGLMAALTYLVLMYRWGTIPATDEERKRTTLQFPEAIWKPFTKINDFWHLVHRGSAFGLALANSCYKNNMIGDMRFVFNYDKELGRHEKNFFLTVASMEHEFSPALKIICEYLTHTELARHSSSHAREVLDKRVDLLGDIGKILIKVMQLLSRLQDKSYVSHDTWVDYVQSITGWSINGIKDGSGAAECLTFNCIDEFLGLPGKGVIYEGVINMRNAASLIQYHKILNALQSTGLEYRFYSFLPGRDNPVAKAKDGVTRVVHLARLLHAKLAGLYLKKASCTSGRTIDALLSSGEEIAPRAESELRERARETMSSCQSE